MIFTELLGITLIDSFIVLVSDISLSEKNDSIYTKLHNLSGFSDPLDCLFLTGVGVLTVLIISIIVSIFTIWLLSLRGSRVGVELANSRGTHYIRQKAILC